MKGRIWNEKDWIYHRLKTSALIEASMMVGAVLAGASDEKIGPP